GLRRRIGVDRRAVLGADIIALAHALSRVVAFPEYLEERLVARHLRVVDHEDGLGVPGLPAAHFFIARVGGRAAGIADRGGPHPGRLPEFALGAPKAPHPEYRLFEPRRIGPVKPVAVDEMLVRHA